MVMERRLMQNHKLHLFTSSLKRHFDLPLYSYGLSAWLPLVVAQAVSEWVREVI